VSVCLDPSFREILFPSVLGLLTFAAWNNKETAPSLFHCHPPILPLCPTVMRWPTLSPGRRPTDRTSRVLRQHPRLHVRIGPRPGGRRLDLLRRIEVDYNGGLTRANRLFALQVLSLGRAIHYQKLIDDFQVNDLGKLPSSTRLFQLQSAKAFFACSRTTWAFSFCSQFGLFPALRGDPEFRALLLR
jgi:hypothetical protein